MQSHFKYHDATSISGIWLFVADIRTSLHIHLGSRGLCNPMVRPWRELRGRISRPWSTWFSFHLKIVLSKNFFGKELWGRRMRPWSTSWRLSSPMTSSSFEGGPFSEEGRGGTGWTEHTLSQNLLQRYRQRPLLPSFLQSDKYICLFVCKRKVFNLQSVIL